jgi:hypothetical protein
MCRFSSGNWVFLHQIREDCRGWWKAQRSRAPPIKCNKLDLIAAQYFWLVDHNDWSRWFAISSSHIYAVPVLLVGLPEKKPAKLRHLILLSRVTYRAPVDMLLKQFRWILSFLPW